MTKKIINADALLEWVNINTHDGGWNGQATIVFQDDLIKKINELATPAPEPQESIYDAEGWGDMYDVPINTEVEVMINCKRIIRAKFDKNLSICTDDIDHNKIKVLNKWRPLPNILKIFAKERILAAKQELASYGVYDDTDTDTDTIKQKFKKGDIVNVCGFDGEFVIKDFVNNCYSIQKIKDDFSSKWVNGITEKSISLADTISNCIFKIGDIVSYLNTELLIEKFVEKEQKNNFMAYGISSQGIQRYININHLSKCTVK